MVGPSLFWSQSCGEHADDNSNYCESLSKDAAPHQQLGLSSFPLVEGAETIYQCSCCPQTTDGDERVVLGFPEKFFFQGFIFDPR